MKAYLLAILIAIAAASPAFAYQCRTVCDKNSGQCMTNCD